LPKKLRETAVAVGPFFHVPTCEVVKRNRLASAAKENIESWYESMRGLNKRPEAKYAKLQARCQSPVKELCTTTAVLRTHFQGTTRAKKGTGGRPHVMYVFPSVGQTAGGVTAFKRRIQLASRVGISPLIVVPSYVKRTPDWEALRSYLESNNIPYDFAWYRSFVVTPPRDDILPLLKEEQSVRQLLTRHPVALVHSGGYIPALGKTCSEMGIPHIVAHYGVEDDYQWPNGHLPFKQCDLVHSDSIRYAKKWAELFESEWFCARDVVPEYLFEIGFERLFGEALQRDSSQPVRLGIVGTLMPRKSQLEAIHAVSMLIRDGHRVRLTIFGDASAHRDYYARCRETVIGLAIADCVTFKGHVEDLSDIYSEMEILLSVSTFESFPTSIKEATSSGVLVVASQVGGIGELMKDGINCILTKGSRPEQIAEALVRAVDLSENESMLLRRNAFRMAREEFHPRRGLLDLLSMYNLALRIHSASGFCLSLSELASSTERPRSTTAIRPPRSIRGLLRLAHSPREMRRIAAANLQILTHEGIGSLWRQVWAKIRRGEFKRTQ
jgi:glycosyltransferase involved in cell wall biosynthesis